LGNAYRERIRGDREDNLEQAIEYYQQALTVRTSEALPLQWAETIENLGNAYRERIRGDRENNLEQAIQCYQQALQVRTREALPLQWAKTMGNLAIAYSFRILSLGNIEQAIAAYQSSLQVFQPHLFPNYCRKVARGLGNLCFEQERWQEATLAYQAALQATENLYRSAILLDSKAAELAETADLPRRAAYALARVGDLQAAVLTLEQGRARGLSETLERDHSDLTQLQQTNPDLFNQYQDITDQLRNLEAYDRQHMTDDNRESLIQKSQRSAAINLRQQFDTLIQEIRQFPGYEKFLTSPTFEDIQLAAPSDRPLVYLVSTPAGSLALIITQDNIKDLWFDNFTEADLRELLYGLEDTPNLGLLSVSATSAHSEGNFGIFINQFILRNSNFSHLGGWLRAYSQSYTNHQAWLDEIEQGTRQLWEPLIAPLIVYLRQHNFQQATLIPTGLLSFFPLHAAWGEDSTTPTGRHYALDEILFTYAPNARSLTAAEVIANRVTDRSILAIDNPTQDLPNSEQEINCAISSFPQSTVLRHTEATIDAVRSQLLETTIVHFSCHGTANLQTPLNSGLLMSDGLFTLRDILNLNLTNHETGGIRLAILSACETGLQGLENADEAISLPTGMLQAGVAAVIASLWSVSDHSTMMLLTRFYDLWRIDGLAMDQALRQAQQWVRDTTNGEKIAYFKDFMPTQSTAKMPASAADYLYKSLILSRPDERAFAHPFHWAAFSYVGV
jgi:CHAT domain-containing protein/tetratricopeptide (TPR) repeat protein